MRILILNCGSSSIKYKLLNMPEGTVLAEGAVERLGGDASFGKQKSGKGELRIERAVRDYREGVQCVLGMLTDAERGALLATDEIEACGHRVVHGGEQFTGSVVVDDDVERGIEANAELAPLHNPPNLMGIREARRVMPAVPHVACFDTAFHHTIPEHAYLYALPYELYEKKRIRRYGFHGSSHRYVTERAAAMLGLPVDEVHLITCHLGSGCSLTAVRNGQSVDTSMGFTPLEGVMMGTRSGSFDPAVLLFLLRSGVSPDELDTMVNRKSGLLGISGLADDMRDLEAAADKGDCRSALALDMFAYQVRKMIGSYLAVLNECHAIVMTGGVGERGPEMRSLILSGMDRLGITLDEQKNAAVRAIEGRVEDCSSRIKILVIPTDEELFIGRETYSIVKNRMRND